jgi:putative ABC transport system permease protein
VLGLVTGALLALALERSIGGSGFVTSFPVSTLIVLVVLAAIAGVVAAVLPARRAARLDILSAVALD